jgi:hypothetical protein
MQAPASCVWVVVNLKVHASRGLPDSLTCVGPGPDPEALAVFTTKEIGEEVYAARGGLPQDWGFMPLDWGTFYDALKSASEQGMVTNVVIDFGTRDGRKHSVEQWLDMLKPGSQN